MSDVKRSYFQQVTLFTSEIGNTYLIIGTEVHKIERRGPVTFELEVDTSGVKKVGNQYFDEPAAPFAFFERQNQNIRRQLVTGHFADTLDASIKQENFLRRILFTYINILDQYHSYIGNIADVLRAYHLAQINADVCNAELFENAAHAVFGGDYPLLKRAIESHGREQVATE